ncbi:MAG: exodeoxyribonuclease VII large subunit [Muribaculaceae bacterium]|nr:exodeoxyribonuclease VII large subunit [Muribaculaceae bacterium]
MSAEAITLLELNRRVGAALNLTPGLNNVWVTAETSDLRTSGSHCYLELIQKDDSGSPLARCRAVIWASVYGRLSAKFTAATGSRLRSDMKIMALVNVSYHPVYGLSLVINDINPDYTIGDLARRRLEIIARLKAEGVYDLNRDLALPDVPWRVAIVSARGAAGYGDFMRQLHNNTMRLRFSTTLFEAVMQGERTAPSIIAALDRIMDRIEDFDCVVVIRGGGAVADLASFDNYDLASNVAQFPLPVICGIGHDRDETVLDYVAHTRVKTPTAAAELLVGVVAEAYRRVLNAGNEILAAVRSAVADQRQQLAYCQGLLPTLAANVVERNRLAVGRHASELLASSVRNIAARAAARLASLGELLDAISPQATLRRGYSITRSAGRAVTDSTALRPGDVIVTTFAKGPERESTVADA